jgi:hypothetical protein
MRMKYAETNSPNSEVTTARKSHSPVRAGALSGVCAANSSAPASEASQGFARNLRTSSAQTSRPTPSIV